LKEAGFQVEFLEKRHVRDAFKAMAVKTDRKDARGIAQLLRLGWFKPVHCKSAAAQEVRALLTARKLVQSKLYDIEMSLRGILRGFGLKIGPTRPKRFAGRVAELTQNHSTLKAIAEALTGVHEALLRELYVFEKQVRMLAKSDKRVRLLMTAPGVGAIVALTRPNGLALISVSRQRSINRGRPILRGASQRPGMAACAPFCSRRLILF